MEMDGTEKLMNEEAALSEELGSKYPVSYTHLIWIASYVERFFEKYLPLVVRNLFTPMFTIAVMVPLTLLAFGPVGNTIGGAIGDVYNFLYGLSPIVAGIFVGGPWEVLVIFGVHWGITPVTVGNYAALGYDTFTGLQAAAVFSQARCV